MNFDVFLKSVSKIKNIPLPAHASQFKMSPPFRKHLIERYKEQMKHAKRAGVMALFYPDPGDQTKLVLILRKTYKGVHSAQIGFPGGKLEPDDLDLAVTATRETHEEIGVPRHTIEVLRQLTEVYIPPSNFYVQPYFGITRSTPTFVRQEEEVEQIIEVDLFDVIDDMAVTTKSVLTSLDQEIEVPAFMLNGHVVWGATAMMLSEIKDLLKKMI